MRRAFLFTKVRQRQHKKLQTNFPYKYNHKISQKLLANRIQLHVKCNIYHGQVKFIPGIQKWFNIRKINVMWYINRKKEKLTTWSSQIMTKSIWQNVKGHQRAKTLFHGKNIQKLGIEGNFLNMIKGIHEKHIGNFILNGERLK